MNIKGKFLKHIMVITPEEKEGFYRYLPKKVYKTERSIAYIVLLTQICMMFLFILNGKLRFGNVRAIGYFSLYLFLSITTSLAIICYRLTYQKENFSAFFWVRRLYTISLCIWVLGITYLEQMVGKGLSVYCYLMPTTAAFILLSPKESSCIFGGTWIGMGLMLFEVSNEHNNAFSNLINGFFVSVLSIFISYRYYHSMAIEYCDRETISSQYQKIEKSNALLKRMIHIDQLTQLYNRRYLLDYIFPMFDVCKEKQHYGMFLMLDIDYFKQYNDTFGHLQGDTCLKKLSEILIHVCDVFGASAVRYGGEEFLIVKMTSNPIDGMAFADQLLLKIKEEDLKRTDVELGRVSVSMGLWNGSLCELTHIENAIRFADTALYKAKISGRNRVIESEE